ncbi:hypothetical protein GCM10011608_44970 [Micromonospora sonchi]|uniref:FR47-like domain-containing protein n=1 Tax=Micromonospora sonchi TaxID=1763543 RepID=A0A917X251_9ACTN|nr:hypothetical protein GCM10011608_44970 [Micromonospora sonchi]
MVAAFRAADRKPRLEYVTSCAPALEAITADITRRLFTAGAEIAWLEASGEESWRVYERVGYRPAGQRLHIALN